MDSIIGILSNKFDVLPIGKQINLIHVSDHGMISSSNIKKDYFRLFKASWLEYAAVIL
jgi:alkaline phosphatase D